jgi:hypothetical protein
MRTLLMLLFVICPSASAAEVLSVQPLAAALRNADLGREAGSPEQLAAQAAVQAIFLNQPSEAERDAYRARLAAMAEHQETRLGQMFFAMLESAPALENLPEGAAAAEITVVWPLALGAEARMRVRWELAGTDDWHISAWTMQLRGAAAALVSAAAPYFGDEPFNAALLDAPELDYLLGRNPLTRDDPDAPEFDSAGALGRYFGREDGAVHNVWQRLKGAVTPEATPEARAAALRPHLFDDAQRQALERANADPVAREEFWARVIEQIAAGADAPRPDSLPTRTGSRVTWTLTARDSAAVVRYTGEALRQRGGNVAPRISRTKEANHDG